MHAPEQEEAKTLNSKVLYEAQIHKSPQVEPGVE
jgi:hypothetical protein